MGKFGKGDRIRNGMGEIATVLDTTEIVLLQWDSNKSTGAWDASFFEKIERSFKPGDFVRSIADDETNGEVGIVIDDDGDDEYSDPFFVALYDKDGTEAPYSVDELVAWFPRVGERVLEAGVDDETEGNIVAISEDRKNARVIWDSFPHPQDFAIEDLEPADEFGEDEFKVGETVIYTNPFFSRTVKAKVLGVEDEVIRVRFEPGTLIADGDYSKDFFSKAA